MKRLDLQKCIVGSVFTNCYFLKNKETEEMLIVDPGDNADRIEQKVLEMQGRPVAILLTHGHFDHILAAEEIKKKYNIIIGERTAEQAKIQIGCAYICDELPEETMAIRGLDTVSGLPREIVISSYEVREAIEEQTTAIVDAVKSTLEQSPPELSADIIENGIYLSGGGALLKGLDRLIEFETNIKTIIAEDALDCVANGLGHIVEESDKYRDIRLYGELDD